MSLIEMPKIPTEKEFDRIIKKRFRMADKLVKVTSDPKKSEEFKKEAVKKGNEEWKAFLKKMDLDWDEDEFLYKDGRLYCSGELPPEPIIYD